MQIGKRSTSVFSFRANISLVVVETGGLQVVNNFRTFTLPKRVLLKMSESRRKASRASQEEAAAHGNGVGGHSRQDRAADMAEDDESAGPPGINEEDDDPARRREIRSQYRDLINSVQQNREDMLNPANNKLFDVLEEANKLFANVSQAREAALDAQLLVLATDLGREKASQLHAEGSAFDPSAFSEHLLSFMGLNRLEEEEDGDNSLGGYLPPDAWKRLSKRAQYCFKTAPSFHYMFGSFLAEPPPPRQRIEKQRKAPSKEAKRIMPIHLKKMEESHQEATGKEVERIFKCLQGHFADDPQSPILYYDFVVDPTSFSRTVENIFHTSFLIRDGVARIYLNSNQLPCIAPVEDGELEPSGANTRHQCVVSISHARWREIIEAFDIKEALIPNPKVLSQDG